jgi:hypothetical protein
MNHLQSLGEKVYKKEITDPREVEDTTQKAACTDVQQEKQVSQPQVMTVWEFPAIDFCKIPRFSNKSRCVTVLVTVHFLCVVTASL